MTRPARPIGAVRVGDVDERRQHVRLPVQRHDVARCADVARLARSDAQAGLVVAQRPGRGELPRHPLARGVATTHPCARRAPARPPAPPGGGAAAARGGAAARSRAEKTAPRAAEAGRKGIAPKQRPQGQRLAPNGANAGRVRWRTRIDGRIRELAKLPQTDWLERYYDVRDAYTDGPWEGPAVDAVQGRARSGQHSVDHVISYGIRDGELVEVSQRNVAAANMR